MKNTTVLGSLSALVFLSVSPLSAQIYVKETSNGTIQLTDQKVDESYRLIIESKLPDDYQMPSLDQLETTVQDVSEKHDVPQSLIYAMITIESAGDEEAQSSEGAIGLMQLMPSTARAMGVEDPLDPHQNIHGGTKYLQKMLSKYDGDLSLSLAAYNAGPGNVDKYGGVPPFEETKRFIKRVRQAFEQFKRESDIIYTYYDERGVLHVTNIH